MLLAKVVPLTFSSTYEEITFLYTQKEAFGVIKIFFTQDLYDLGT